MNATMSRNIPFTSSGHRSWSFTGAALAAALGLAFAVAGVARDMSNGDDLGTLPGSQGDGRTFIDPRPAVYLEGDSEADLSGLYSAFAGTFDIFVQEVDGGVRHVFVGSGFELAVDEQKLVERRLRLGVLASIAGGTVQAQVQWEGVTTPVVTIPAGGVLELPFVRMQDAGLLDDVLTVRTFQRTHLDGSLTLQTGSGLLMLRQEN